MRPLRAQHHSIGRIVFVSLLLMALGALAIAFISVKGIQSFRAEFDRLTAKDLPQATLATRLNGEISGLTGQIGSLAAASSEMALGTIRLQIGDQLAAIDRLKTQLRAFPLRPGDYEVIDQALTELTANFEEISALSSQALRAAAALDAQRAEMEDQGIAQISVELQLWLRRLDHVTRGQEIDALARALEDMPGAAPPGTLASFAAQMLEKRRNLLAIETALEGRLHRHMQLSAQLTDATRFMSSRLMSDVGARSSAIEGLSRSTLYLILFSLLGFAAIAGFIHIYLDKNVVGRVQQLTQLINAYEGAGATTPRDPNEITRIETAFSSLTETIAERENRLLALSETATEARKEAEQANRSKSTLLAAASHDLRQPLHAMGLLIGGIDRAGLDASSHDSLDRLAGLTQETIGLFNSILDLSKLEAGTFTASCQPVDLGAILTRIEADFAPRAALAGAPFKVETPAAPLHVLADEDALYRIINNLVVNAIAYAAPAQITLGFQQDAGRCTVVLSDLGPGLRPKDRAGPAGYGLGLSISFALAEAMQTMLRYELPATGGTRFILPLQKVAAPSFEHYRPVPAAANGALAGLKVIFLEDNSEICAATTEGLLRLGCQVTACSTADETIAEIAAANAPFLMITDLDLGRGHSAINAVGVAFESSVLPLGVIVTTANPALLPQNWHIDRRVQVLDKPFSIGRLASVMRYLSARRAELCPQAYAAVEDKPLDAHDAPALVQGSPEQEI